MQNGRTVSTSPGKGKLYSPIFLIFAADIALLITSVLFCFVYASLTLIEISLLLNSELGETNHGDSLIEIRSLRFHCC